MDKTKSFSCCSCDKVYRWKCDLRRHQVLKHQNDVDLQTPDCITDINTMDLIEDGNYRFEHPFTMTISGPTASGKTHFTRKILENCKINPHPERIVYIYKRWQPLYDTLKATVRPDIEFIRGIPDDLDADSFFQTGRNNIIILDDMMDIASNHKAISDLFTEGSHHRNLSVINLTQSLFPKGKNSVTQRRNTQYLVIFKSPMSQDQIGHLGRFMFPKKLDQFMSVYRKATAPAYGYLIIDGKVNTPLNRRLITNIFGNQSGSGTGEKNQTNHASALLKAPSEMLQPKQSLPPPPGIPNSDRVGRAIKTHTSADSFSDTLDTTDEMDYGESTPCKYCGILFNDSDNLRKHILNGCIRKREGTNQATPIVPNSNQVGRGLKRQTSADSLADSLVSHDKMDYRDSVPCKNCGILFNDSDNLQEHLLNGCIHKRQGEYQVTLGETRNKKQRLFDAFDEDIREDPVFARLFEDAKEINKDKLDEMRERYIVEGLTEKEASRRAQSDMMKEYKADFFSQYTQLLESIYELRKNGVHNLIEEEIDELAGKNRNMDKIIRWVLAKNKFMFEELFSKDIDSEDSDDTDTQSVDSEASSESND